MQAMGVVYSNNYNYINGLFNLWSPLTIRYLGTVPNYKNHISLQPETIKG